MPTWSARVGASSDDAEELYGTSDMSLTSSTLDLNRDTVGMRWTNVLVPKNATINSVTLTFTARSSDSSTLAYLYIGAQAADDAPTFTTATSDIVSRALGASYAYPVTAWVAESTYAFSTGPGSPLAAAIQAVVNRTGWASGNALVMVVQGGNSPRRRAYAYDDDPAKAPLLYIDYAATDVVLDGNVGVATVSTQSGDMVPGLATVAGNVKVATVVGLQGVLSEDVKLEGNVRAVTVVRPAGDILPGASSLAGAVEVATVTPLTGRVHYNIYADRTGVAGGGALVDIYR